MLRRERFMYYEGSRVGTVLTSKSAEEIAIEVLHHVGIDISFETPLNRYCHDEDYSLLLEAKDIVIQLDGIKYYHFYDYSYEEREVLRDIIELLNRKTELWIEMYERRY